jgi:hypothetical protein
MSDTCGFGCSKVSSVSTFLREFFHLVEANTVDERNVGAFVTAESSSVWIAS